MNILAIDYGTRRIGLAYTINNIIFTLNPVNNDDFFYQKLNDIISEYNIEKIYVGVSEGKMAKLSLRLVVKLKAMLKLPIETVEEAVSTIEATEIYKQNKSSQRNFKSQIDSVAAAVILRRVINWKLDIWLKI